MDDIWIIPCTKIHLPDGCTLLKPGKAIQRANATRTSRLTGVHRKTLSALADCGLIRRDRPSPGLAFFYPAEIESFLAQTAADPGYWTSVKTKAFLIGQDLRNSHPR